MKQTFYRFDEDAAWAAVKRRDREQDGRFVTGVLSTGIYCRPSCAARHPKRCNIRFFSDGAAARAAGLRPCRRCRPDDVARDSAAITAALELMAERESPPTLAELAGLTGYSPTHFQRVFKRALGLSPASYARGLRGRRLARALGQSESVTEAIYDAGYSGPARFYADVDMRLGMTPSAWKAGGAGETIRWARAATRFGDILVAATPRGICRLAFDEDEASLRQHFPCAEILAGGTDMRALLDAAIAAVDAPAGGHGLPLDVRGTAFQEAVWRALSGIPAGETISYAALAARAGAPGAARAAGSACGANPVAILVPCHRAVRADGSAGNYAYGEVRKAAILAAEQQSGEAGEGA